MHRHDSLFKLARFLIPIIGVPFFTIIFFMMFMVVYTYGELILFYILEINTSIWICPVCFYAILLSSFWYWGQKLYKGERKLFWLIYPSLILGVISSLYFSFEYVLDGPV